MTARICPGLFAGSIASVLALLAFSCTVAFDSELSALDAGCDWETEKRCHQGCVPKNDPSTGCGQPECNPCAFAHGGAVCDDKGACQIGECFGPWENCVLDDDGVMPAKKGCETNIFTSLEHCGHCDLPACKGIVRPHVKEPACLAEENVKSANPSRAVIEKNCGIGRCEVGWGDCDGNPTNGCEHDVSEDAANCGQCERRCPTGETCRGGVCKVVASGG